MDVLSNPVLVLNSGYLPVGIKSVRDAICMILLQKADVVKAEEDLFIRSEKLQLPAPRIILLLNYHYVPRKKAKLSRKNILARDNYTCLYCGKTFPTAKLTIDHIVPRSRWASISSENKPQEFNSWDNVATACKDCNTKKGNKLISELRWKYPNIKKNKINSISISHVSEKTVQELGWDEYLVC
ncbi:MAG: HNH endonuclease [Leptospiraceae bacterium]|nr:HNH endonuclease [Leptospiraceae bacterium]